MYRILLLSFVALAVPAAAAPKPHVAVLDFSGPHARTTRAHFVNQLCHVVACLKTGGDGSKTPADAVITGDIETKGKGEVLTVNVISSADGRTVTRSYALTKRGLVAQPNAVGPALSRVVAKMIPKEPPPKPKSVANAGSKKG